MASPVQAITGSLPKSRGDSRRNADSRTKDEWRRDNPKLSLGPQVDESDYIKLEELGLGTELLRPPPRRRAQSVSLGPQSDETDYIKEGELNLDFGVAKSTSLKTPIRLKPQIDETDYIKQEELGVFSSEAEEVNRQERERLAQEKDVIRVKEKESAELSSSRKARKGSRRETKSTSAPSSPSQFWTSRRRKTISLGHQVEELDYIKLEELGLSEVIGGPSPVKNRQTRSISLGRQVEEIDYIEETKTQNLEDFLAEPPVFNHDSVKDRSTYQCAIKVSFGKQNDEDAEDYVRIEKATELGLDPEIIAPSNVAKLKRSTVGSDSAQPLISFGVQTEEVDYVKLDELGLLDIFTSARAETNTNSLVLRISLEQQKEPERTNSLLMEKLGLPNWGEPKRSLTKSLSLGKQHKAEETDYVKATSEVELTEFLKEGDESTSSHSGKSKPKISFGIQTEEVDYVGGTEMELSEFLAQEPPNLQSRPTISFGIQDSSDTSNSEQESVTQAITSRIPQIRVSGVRRDVSTSTLQENFSRTNLATSPLTELPYVDSADSESQTERTKILTLFTPEGTINSESSEFLEKLTPPTLRLLDSSVSGGAVEESSSSEDRPSEGRKQTLMQFLMAENDLDQNQ